MGNPSFRTDLPSALLTPPLTAGFAAHLIKQMLLIGATLSGTAALAQTPLKSVFALPGVTEKVSAELVVRESGPLTRELLIAFTDKATGCPITEFEEELTQQLHVLATDSDFSSFVHEHGGKPGTDGRFSVVMRFPKPGTYHVYADAMPKGLGQQVVRFEVPVVAAAAAAAAPQVTPGSDGPYSVKLDTSALRVGRESMMMLTVLKNGKPATDLGLYLGVAAHAVFVNTEDLSYVHAHAMAADTAKGGHGNHGNHGGHVAHGASTDAARMMLHATPPRAGRYALWIQFKGGNQVRTVPFVVNVAAAP